jgi:hypothetical protein
LGESAPASKAESKKKGAGPIYLTPDEENTSKTSLLPPLPPPPSPIGGKFKNSRGRGLQSAANPKVVNLKWIFLKKYWDDFLSKNMLRISET